MGLFFKIFLVICVTYPFSDHLEYQYIKLSFVFIACAWAIIVGNEIKF